VNPLVVITQVREIPECVESWEALSTPVACLRGWPMVDLPPVMADLVDSTDHDPILMCADDCVITQHAVDAVLELLADGHPVVTGWCLLDRTHPLANLSTRRLPPGPPTKASYTFPRGNRVQSWPEPSMPTYFVGMCLTGMSRAMWQRFPLDGYSHRGAMWATDYHLSQRLAAADIPMVAARDGFVVHVKEKWMQGDTDPRKRILIGSMKQEVVYL
jgi:hypothetical protein